MEGIALCLQNSLQIKFLKWTPEIWQAMCCYQTSTRCTCVEGVAWYLQNLWCFGDGEHIANQVLEVDLIDLAGYVLLSKTYRAAGKWDLTANVQRQRLERGVKI